MCDFGYGDLEIAKVWVERVYRAAKAHRCTPCGATISRGEHYIHHVSILDSVERERMCFACWWAREDFHQEHPGSPSIMPSMLEEFLRECLRDTENASRWMPYLAGLELRRHQAEAARAAVEA